MAVHTGYLLPTRERIMEGLHPTGPLLDLASRAAALRFDSVWVGDSLTARPRHDPLMLLAAVAGRAPSLTLGTAVLLPALRNPVVLAHQIATLDRLSEGKLILGVGFASDRPNIRAEFAAAGVPWDLRLGRMMEGLRLCKALWTGQKVDWDGRWQMQQATVAPTPHRPGGPPLWIGGNQTASLDRAGRFFDGWFPNSPSPEAFPEKMAHIRNVAAQHGRNPASISGALYLTVCVNENAAEAEARLDHFLEGYYSVPAAATRARQICYAGGLNGLGAWLAAYENAGATHLVLRFAGDHERHMEAVARVRGL